MSFMRRIPGRFLIRLGVLMALTAVIGVAYQAVENYIPYWDYARIESLYNQLEAGFQNGPVSGIGWLLDQVNRAEYNSVFALPMMVAPALFGQSRDSIVLATLLINTMLYLFAFGLLLRRVFGHSSLDDVTLAQLGSALLVPSIFTATMLGFETIAVLPVLTAGLIVFIAASWPAGEVGRGRRLSLFFLAGGLLAATFLIRRAYAYTVISFYTTAGLVFLGELVLGMVSWRSREAWTRIMGMVAAGLGSATVLLLVARDRVLAVLSTPYQELYAPWKMVPARVALQLLSSVGGLILVLSAVGYLLRRKVVPKGHRAMVALLGGTAAFGFAHWIVLVRLRMRLDKPLLYAPMIALGLAMLFTGRDQRKWSNIARGLCMALLLVNLGISLGAVPDIRAVGGHLFADPLPPQTRDDMDEYREMVGWLRQATGSDNGRGEPILVLGATGNINDSLVKEAENHFFGSDDRRLNIPHFNSVDRTSNYPIWLHEAVWVLVPRPFQFHTSLEERRLLRFGWDEFNKNRGVSANFEKLDVNWVIGRRAAKPVKIEVWRRIRADSPAQVLDMINRARDFIVHPPVFPNLWIANRASGGFTSTRVKRSGAHYKLIFSLAGGADEVTSAVLLQPLEGGVDIRGAALILRGKSADVEFVAELLDINGLRAGTEEVLLSSTFPVRKGVENRLDFRLPPEHDAGLLQIGLHRGSGKRGVKKPVRVMLEIEIDAYSR